MVSAQARDKGLALQQDLDARLPQRVRGDAQRLTQALVNLLGNAVKFTQRGWVRLQVSVLAQEGERLQLRFEVSDSGEGIEPEEIERLFKAFEQADNTSTRRHGGTGLGLALTRHLASLMGGQAGASSQPGVGSRFWFTAWLKAAPEAGQALVVDAASTDPAPPAATPADTDTLRLTQRHAGRRILLAEDNPVNLEVALELLVSVGLVVECASDGAQAVEMALARPYDLVFMDMQMPVLDGLQATRRIRQRLGPALPVIAMTANAFGDDRHACLDAGMNDHVAKPVNPELLYACVLRWLPQAGPMLSAVIAAPLPERLAALEGFNYAQALHNMGGRQATLERALARFVASYAQGAPELLLAPDAGTLLRWRAAAHSLRGACGTIGANRLYQSLRDFECALDAQADPHDLELQARQIHQHLGLLVDRLARELNPTGASVGVPSREAQSRH
jgi:two-component system sensor histidine kinase/response regulator